MQMREKSNYNKKNKKTNKARYSDDNFSDWVKAKPQSRKTLRNISNISSNMDSIVQ